jgi:alkylation response protein AidB-like acyl-CoA dehydrogenase
VLGPLALASLGGDETQRRLLPAIAGGGTRVAVALPAGPSELAEDLPVTARWDGAAFRLRGRARFVIDGASADVLLVLAGDDHARPRLFTVAAEAGGLARTPLDTLDATRKQADLDFEGVEASAAGPPASPESLARVLAGAAVALAAEQAGGAERTLEDAVSYAQLRQQFGRPIGSFQAVKHKCADMLMAAESAKTAAWYAAWAMATGADGAVAASRVAKAICSEAFLSNAGENLQVHGGIGFTWECDAHLHLKRARSSWALFGAPPELRELTADAMELR